MNESNNAALPSLRQIEPICVEFEKSWRAGRRPAIREHLERVPEPFRDGLLVELYRLDVEYRRLAGESALEQDYLAEFPELARALAAALSAASSAPSASLLDTAVFDSAVGPPSPIGESAEHSTCPSQYGRYVVGGQLGSGTFGVVYRGWDPELKRDVATSPPQGQQPSGRRHTYFFWRRQILPNTPKMPPYLDGIRPLLHTTFSPPAPHQGHLAFQRRQELESLRRDSTSSATPTRPALAGSVTGSAR